jgi:hypothetical protein
VDILLEVEDPHLRFLALPSLVCALAPTDLEKAAALTGLAAEPRQVQALLLDIARAIARQDSKKALSIIQRSPASPEKREALLDIAAIIAPTDLKRALAIASNGWEAGPAGHALVLRLARQDPSLAMSIASEIRDPFLQAHAFCDIAEALLEEEGGPSAAALSRPEVQRVIEPGGAAGEPAEAGGQIEILSAQPHQLKIRLAGAAPGLYTLHCKNPRGSFTWENLRPDAEGVVILKDDNRLLPRLRLACPSRGTESDPAFFDDFTKADYSSRQRLPFGIPVSTFGGAGHLCSAPAWVQRDVQGSFWIYQDLRPWRIVSFDSQFNYRFSLVFPTRILALDSDPQGNLYVLQEGNFLSRFDSNGRPLAHWKLKEGRGSGEFVQASGLAVDPLGQYLYLADKKLGRVQRFNLQMRPAPFHFLPWGWIGRENLTYLELGSYNTDSKYRLDRPGRLAISADGLLYVDCAYYLARFDLASGKQVPFGKYEVLGWGGSFTDSPHSPSAAANGHWQEHCLAGIDPEGNIYISDTTNAYLAGLRLQVFSPAGEFIARYDRGSDIHSAAGSPAYITPPRAIAFSKAPPSGKTTAWLVEAGGRVYEGPGLASGGRFHLGPGAAGKQFDLTQVSPQDFSIEAQTEWKSRSVEGEVVTYNPGRRGTRNCEMERNAEIPHGAKSIWIPVRLGEPFQITLLEKGEVIPPFDYEVEIETQPGPFGTQYDFFRVTNKSSRTWKGVRFIAETLAP